MRSKGQPKGQPPYAGLLRPPADIDGTPDSGDQVTTYSYGVSKGTGAGDSRFDEGGLLRTVAQPDSSDSTDVVTHAHNAHGQKIWRKFVDVVVETG